MPEQFYGTKVSGGGLHQAQELPMTPTPTPTPSPKAKKKLLPTLIVVVLVILLLISGWLLYLSFKPKTPIALVVEEPLKTEPITVVVVEEPVIVTPVEESSYTVEVPQVPVVPVEDLTSKPLELMMSVDTDKDNLTDAEELLIGTDVNNQDSDGDGFIDGQEVLNLYNPLAKDPAGIEFSGVVTTYVNPTFDYDVYYSQKWVAKAVDQANLEIMFTAATGEFVEVLISDNAENLSLRDWYKKQAPTVKDDEIVSFTNKNGLNGIKSPDSFTVYFAKGQYVYVITYNIGMKELADYPNLFKMMVESFTFTGEE